MEPSDAASRATSREHVSRIDRGYYKRPSPQRAWRAWLVVAGFTAAAAWCVWAVVDRPLQLAPGPVVAGHARWEQDCNACHVPFMPIKDDTWLSSDRTRAAMDAKCEACHRSAVHHPLQVLAEVGSCVSCHADHRGRMADISRVADGTCTACHADIGAHRVRVTGTSPVQPSAVIAPITRFDDEHHPAFASLRSDPGRLKFSHGRHMTAGLVFGAATKDGPFTWQKLSATDRARLMPSQSSPGDPVQLACASCHEFAATPSVTDSRVVPARLAAASPGAYALPVTFERHCVACHPLPYDPEATNRSLPHGLDPEGMRRFIATAMLESSADGKAALDAPPRPAALPANVPQDPTPLETLREALHRRVETVRSFTRGTCGKCHDVADVDLPASPLLNAIGSRPEPWFRISPVGVPDVWLAKARFDHVPHRSFDCRTCHAAAYPPAPGAGPAAVEQAAAARSPLDHGTVMIAGRESCTACHAPAALDAHGRPVGGARFDCVECHGYHGLGPHSSVPAHALVPGVIATGTSPGSR